MTYVSPASGDALARADADAVGVAGGVVADSGDVVWSEGLADPVDPPQPTTNRASIAGRIVCRRPRRVPPLRATTLIDPPPRSIATVVTRYSQDRDFGFLQ
jgi:hypothetical protein